MREGLSWGLRPTDMRSPMVSIVVRVSNEADAIVHFIADIDAAIGSAWSASEPERPPQFEILFVDDGRTDGTNAPLNLG